MTPECPLCSNPVPRLLEVIETADLIELYHRSVGVDVSMEFRGFARVQYYSCQLCDLAFFFPMIAGSNQFYARMQRLPWYYLDEKAEYQFARTFLKGSKKLLEVGCGKGAFAAMSPAREYTCLELSPEAAALAQSRGVSAMTESIEEHAAANPEVYDAVCAFQVLEHVAELGSFIATCIMCLKPSGLLLYSVPSADSFARHIPSLATNLPPHHVTRWSDQALRSIARLFPVQVVALWHEPLEPFHADFYASAIVQEAIMRAFRRDIKVVDPSSATRTIAALSRYLGRRIAGRLTRGEQRLDGLSVVCIYRKAQ